MCEATFLLLPRLKGGLIYCWLWIMLTKGYMHCMVAVNHTYRNESKGDTGCPVRRAKQKIVEESIAQGPQRYSARGSERGRKNFAAGAVLEF